MSETKIDFKMTSDQYIYHLLIAKPSSSDLYDCRGRRVDAVQNH